MIRGLFRFQLYPLVVVKVDIIIDDLFGLLERRVLDSADGFFFEMSKEVLHGSIVPAIPASGHGRRDVILISEEMIRMGCVLMPLVTVEDDSISDLFFILGIFDHLGDQTDRVVSFELMSNNETIIEILDGSEVGPALLGVDIGDVGDPFLVGAIG